MRWGKKIISSILIITVLGFFVNLGKTIFDTYHAGSRVGELAEEVDQLRTHKKELAEEKEYRETDSFLEKEARDKLNLVKPGDTVYVISGRDRVEAPLVKEETPAEISTTKQWQELFVKGLKSLY